MLIVSQCGTGVFDTAHFVGAWVKDCGNNIFLLKALFRNKEVILGTFNDKAEAIAALNLLINHLLNQNNKIYQI